MGFRSGWFKQPTDVGKDSGCLSLSILTFSWLALSSEAVALSVKLFFLKNHYKI